MSLRDYLKVEELPDADTIDRQILEQRIENQDAEIDELRNDVAGLHEKNLAQGAWIDQIEGELGDVKADLWRMEEKLIQTQDENEGLRKAYDEIKDEVERLRSKRGE